MPRTRLRSLRSPPGLPGLRRSFVLVSAVLAAGLVGLLSACTPGGMEENVLRRGDIAFARDSLEEALAEYRLAVRQGRDDAATLARVGHTYARMGRVNEAGDFYERAQRTDPSMADQAAADFVYLAREAAERGDRFLMASSMDGALRFRPGISVEEMALPLARHYFRSGEYGRALPFYQKALVATNDSVPDLVFEIAQAYEEIGDCPRALVFFERFRAMVQPWERGEVDWYIGNCAYRVAREKRLQARQLFLARQQRPEREDPVDDSLADLPPAVDEEGRPLSREELLEDALRMVDRTLEVEEPRNILGQVWFEKGEILSALGDCRGAMDAFDRVQWVEPTRNTPLARRAQERFDQLRFGEGLQRFLGGCG